MRHILTKENTTVRIVQPNGAFRTVYLNGAHVQVVKLERNTDGRLNGIALVRPVRDSYTHKISKRPFHIGTRILSPQI